MTRDEARVKLQKSRLSLIQEAANFKDVPSSHMTFHLVKARSEILKKNWKKFQKDHEAISLSSSSSRKVRDYNKARMLEQCQDSYILARAKLLELQTNLNSNNHQSQTYTTRTEANTRVVKKKRNTLPKIDIPKFSGDYSKWKSFYDLFTSIIINDEDLTNVERLHYLKTGLTGEAEKIISNIPVTEENFPIAWNLLTGRYENKRFLINSQLDRLSQLKPLKGKSAQGLNILYTTLSEVVSALRALSCEVQHWDPILLHQVVRLLDPDSREAWEIELGSSSTLPSYKQFEDFLLSRACAMENLGQASSFSSNKHNASEFRSKANVHITSTESNNSSECILCKAPHQLMRCERYLSKTPHLRREYIIKNKRCFNCLGTHTVYKCTNIKRCFKCGKKHHTTLHDSFLDSNQQIEKSSDIKEVVSESKGQSNTD